VAPLFWPTLYIVRLRAEWESLYSVVGGAVAQEVTLRRQRADDRLGLTLVYRDTAADDGAADVIVGQVRSASSRPTTLH